MVKKRCMFCKNIFETGNPQQDHCGELDCEIKFEYLKLASQGIDPREHFRKLIESGAERKCCVCKKRFKPGCVSEFFTKICKDCKKKMKKEHEKKLFDSILDDPRKALDSV